MAPVVDRMKVVQLLLVLLPFSSRVEARVGGGGDVVSSSPPTAQSSNLEACNAHLHAEPCTTTWSQLFGTRSHHTDTVVIPCGKCVVMDHGVNDVDKFSLQKFAPTKVASSLSLESGLDIQGKLIFHDGYGLDLITTQIVVQGELNVATWTTSQQLISTTPNGRYEPTLNITFHEFDGPATSRTMTSATTTTSYMRGYNTAMSSPGMDRFIVAGGKVIVRGNHEESAHKNSWTIVNDSDNANKVLLGWVAPVSQGPLEDTEEVSQEDDASSSTIHSSSNGIDVDFLSKYVPPRFVNNIGGDKNSICDNYIKSGGVLFDYDFSVIHASKSKPKLRSSGSNDFVKQGELFNKIHDSKDGPEIPFLSGGMDACLEVNRPYLVTARIEMPKKNPQTKYTNCAKSGTDCVSLLTTNRDYSNNVTHWSEQESHQTLFGEILTVAATVVFRGDETKMLIRGGPEGIHVLSFTVQLPPKYSFVRRSDIDDEESGSQFELDDGQLEPFPSQTEVAYCPDLVPPNGNAEEAGLHPFPFGTNNPFTHIVVEEDENDQSFDGNINHYFAISGRRYSMHVFNPEIDDFKASGLSWDIPTPCLIKPHQTGARYR